MALLCSYCVFYMVLCIWSTIGESAKVSGLGYAVDQEISEDAELKDLGSDQRNPYESANVSIENDFIETSDFLRLLRYVKLVSALSPANFVKRLKKFDVESVNGVDTGACSAALDVFEKALVKGDVWALQMLDASSKIPVGVFGGNLVDLGAYDECVDISVTGHVDADFTGQHCLAVLHLNFTKPPDFAPPGVLAVLGNALAYTFALCLPSSCSPETIGLALEDVANDVNPALTSANLTIQFSVDQTDCHVKLRPPLDTAEVVGIVVTLCSLIVVAISTTIDLTLGYNNEQADGRGLSTGLQLLTSFSLYTNGRRLMDTRVAEGSLSVLHALKFLSIAWVTLGHRIRFSVQAPLTNLLNVADYVEDWSSMIVLNATLSVDVFFLISGILNTYVYMNLARRRGKTLMSHLVGYVHRYLRLTPAYGLMIVVTATWLYRTGDGPLWDRLVGGAKNDCTQNWWTGLLYINNYVNPNSNCMMQSWYLAADMQLFWLSPLVLYPLWRWPRLGLTNLFLLAIVSIIVPFVVAFVDQIKTPIPISFDTEKVNREMAELYFPTHTKTVSYFIGILTGYILHLHRANKIRMEIHWVKKLGLWYLAVAFLGYGLFGGYYIFQLDSDYDQWQSSFYIGVYRFFWSVGLAWVILACTTGHGGFLNSWLSLKIFAPLGRLTYAIYLTHVAVILYGVGSLRQPQHFTYFEMIHKFLGDFVIAIFLAIILSLTIEAPIMVLEKILLKDRRDAPRRVGTIADSTATLTNNDLHHQA
ncbi:nose resistant to fluoxetine protein 6-like [Macrosteles quadrilineatus]|uniref:nose resistant to fluoxetine protein 6-like n=1 Tax=Macrosteles quadrilineatus TaxID=74068 RepID=UPI0023E35069|nr:nose resistant to fluoxetine protein 6-like [Macrosteles quadrilineatus]